MLRSPCRTAALPAALIFVLCVVAPVAGQPVAELEDSVDVDLVNVDVVVTGTAGAPIEGLGRDAFEVLVDGQPVAVTHFAEAAGGAPGPTLLVWLDLESLAPADAAELLAALREALPRIVDAADGIALAVRGLGAGRLVVGPTRDRAALDAVLEAAQGRFAGRPAGRTSERLLAEIRAAERPKADSGEAFEAARRAQVEGVAAMLLAEVREEAAAARARQAAALADLRPLVSAAAALPGRKVLLWLGGGLDPRPGEALYRAWLDKFRESEVATRGGSVALESDGGTLGAELAALENDARAGRLAIYPLTPSAERSASGPRTDAVAAFSTAGAPATGGGALAALAAGTGGAAATGTDVAALLGRLSGERGRYVLGFPVPAPGQEAVRALEVRARVPEARLRHASAFRRRTPRDRLVALALAALYFDRTENPLSFSVELGRPRAAGEAVVVPAAIQLPLRRLTFLPSNGGFGARVAVVTAAERADGGELGAVGSFEVPIGVDAAEMAAARRRAGGFTAALELAPGRWRLGVALRDELGGAEGAVRLELELGDDEVVRNVVVSSRRVEAPAPPQAPDDPAGSTPEPAATTPPAPPAAEVDAPERRRAAARRAEARAAMAAAVAAWTGGAPIAAVANAWADRRVAVAAQDAEGLALVADGERVLAQELGRRASDALLPLSFLEAELMRRHSARREPAQARQARESSAALLDDWLAASSAAARLAAGAWLVLAADTTVREFVDLALARAAAIAPDVEVVAMAAAAEAERGGRLDVALGVLDRFLARHPAHPEARLRRGLVLARAGRAEAAEHELTRLAGDDAAPPWVLSLGIQELARARERAGRADLAIERLRAGLARLADDPLLTVQLAWQLERTGAGAEARALVDALGSREHAPASSPRHHYGLSLAERVADLRAPLAQAAAERLPALAAALAEVER